MSAASLFIVLALFLSVCLAEQQHAHLLVSKQILNFEIILGREAVVVYKIYNIGDGYAHDIAFHDPEWEGTEIFQINGQPSARWEKLAPGSSITHIITVKPTSLGILRGGRATVTYESSLEGQVETVLSTEAGIYQIIKLSDFERQNLSHLFEWGVFSILAAIPLIVPLVLWRSSALVTKSKRK